MVTVVKIGGSLFPEHVNRLCECFKKSKEKIVLINGGGDLANILREYHEEYNYSNNVNHWTAIECMNIIGKLIADKNRNINLFKKLDELKSSSDGILQSIKEVIILPLLLEK